MLSERLVSRYNELLCSMHAIIAGSNKAGTTSLFRYLADHPQISPSRRKETDFFLKDIGPDVDRARASYEALFAHRHRSIVRLEASPAYLKGGRTVAQRIARTAPDARLIFVLREPASRLISYLRVNAQNLYKEAVAALDHDAYVQLVERVAAGEAVPAEPCPMRNAMLQYQTGCYAPHLREYFEYFDTDRVRILFFDDLVSDERQVTQLVCRDLGIDETHYERYDFEVENRTGNHRLLRVHRAVARLNMRLEPWFNDHPTVRKALRRIYRVVNERHKQPDRARTFDETLVRRLEAVYRVHNADLATLLTARYPGLALPAWVRGAEKP
jgi:hypothetical protein